MLLEMVNDTAWPHGMHLHGHHFRAVSADGSLGPWRDTLLMDREETVRIAFVTDNPGDWLLHCHMLEHHVPALDPAVAEGAGVTGTRSRNLARSKAACS